MSEIARKIQTAAGQLILFLPHAVRQMSRFEPMISPQEVEKVILIAEVIENYPEDIRGHSCLLLGRGIEGRPVHVVCAPKDEYLAIITAYLPEPSLWSTDFRERLQ